MNLLTQVWISRFRGKKCKFHISLQKNYLRTEFDPLLLNAGPLVNCNDIYINHRLHGGHDDPGCMQQYVIECWKFNYSATF